MILSASYRTDIPAFYAAWFLNRFRAGRVRVKNPYGGQPIELALRDGVDGYVFWTRNIGPFQDALGALCQAGLPFVVQYTVTGYPRALETAIGDPARSIALIHELAQRHGRRSVVWRYDPILITDLTPPDWHRQNFAVLARGLEGATDEVVISFAQLYRKTLRNLNLAAHAHGFRWHNPEPAPKRALARDLAAIARDHGMVLTLCTQPDLIAADLPAARCIDRERLSDQAGRMITARTKGNRPGCLCAESRDIGDYDSCPHGCVYCYAVSSRETAKARLQAHDPAGEGLIPAL
ncbi:MAG: DUF1848 domain-containing protein [Azospirillaceae bacterium]|nr:DUF1848 domain-containing protein [Azospirillaceae bacterium]